jgi:hypothetical protein
MLQTIYYLSYRIHPFLIFYLSAYYLFYCLSSIIHLASGLTHTRINTDEQGTESNRTEQSRAEQSRAEQGRAGQRRAEQNRIKKIEQSRAK